MLKALSTVSPPCSPQYQSLNIGQAVWAALYSLLNISETVRDKSLVPKDHRSEMVYGELNGHMTHDVM